MYEEFSDYSVSYGITIGEKWTTVLPSKIDVDFIYSAESPLV